MPIITIGSETLDMYSLLEPPESEWSGYKVEVSDEFLTRYREAKALFDAMQQTLRRLYEQYDDVYWLMDAKQVARRAEARAIRKQQQMLIARHAREQQKRSDYHA